MTTTQIPAGEENARAIITRVKISKWTGRKHDKDLTQAAIDAFQADPAAGRFSKNCIPATTRVEKQVEKTIKKGLRKGQKVTETVVVETNSLIALNQHLDETRRFWYEQTLEWATGERVLPIANWDVFTAGWRERLARYEQLLPEFVADYPDLIRMSRKLLNGAWKEKDYPKNIEAEFALKLGFEKMPTGRESKDIRIALGAEDIAMIEASIEARAKEGWERAQGDAVTRLYEAVSKIVTRLKATKVSKRKKDNGEEISAGYKDTLIENARDLCDVLTRLNVANDPRLEAFRRETELLATVEPETLRKNADVAAETCARAEDIRKGMIDAWGEDFFANL